MASSEMPTILSSDSGSSDSGGIQSYDPSDSGSSTKKIVLILVGLALVVGLIVFFVVRSFLSKVDNTPKETIVEEVDNPQPILPTYEEPEDNQTSLLATTTDLKIEYLSFSDFYNKADNSIQAGFEDYSLPINTKIDVLNYYDISRKIDLDPVLDDLNNNGFGVISSPWNNEDKDFYSVYSTLVDKQIPLLITSDFLIYYHQNILKKVFKDIEENIFYDNLWDINMTMYDAAKTRYEARFSKVGNVNDPLLEGARLEMVFFAVSLELLKPIPDQIAETGVTVSQEKFSVAEANKFSFSAPLSIRDNVEAEVALIREGKQNVKSPVLLYQRNYKDFSVPYDYRDNAKLNNFYLTSKWLNSVFPLYSIDTNCPNCLLDKEDWRVSFIAAMLMSDDFSSLPQLKNRWARIYKVISFFKGLRDDLDYIDYRDTMISIFGEDYNVDEIFEIKENPEFYNNLDKLAEKLSTYQFLEIQGGPSPSDIASKVNIGFKMLASSYSPDDYLLGRLSRPTVNNYLGGENAASNNITYCRQSRSVPIRCNGIALDIVNLVFPVTGNDYFIENSNYYGYSQESSRLRNEISASVEKHTTNYWSSLGIMKNFLEMDRGISPIYTRSNDWRNKTLITSASSWANLQIPFEKFSLNKSFEGQSLSDFSRWSENSYVEPNLNLVNDLLSVNKMVFDMLSALKINSEVRLAIQEVQTSTFNLENIKNIIVKEIQGDKIDALDYESIIDFATQLEITNKDVIKEASWSFPDTNKPLKVNLSDFDLMVIISQRDGSKFFSVGPVWHFREYR